MAGTVRFTGIRCGSLRRLDLTAIRANPTARHALCSHRTRPCRAGYRHCVKRSPDARRYSETGIPISVLHHPADIAFEHLFTSTQTPVRTRTTSGYWPEQRRDAVVPRPARRQYPPPAPRRLRSPAWWRLQREAVDLPSTASPRRAAHRSAGVLGRKAGWRPPAWSTHLGRVPGAALPAICGHRLFFVPT